MKVQVGVEVVLVTCLDLTGMVCRNIAVANVLADHSPILGLRQTVVVGMTGPRLGLFDQTLAQKLRYGAVNILTAAIGMEAANGERKLPQNGCQQEFQPCFA